MPRTRNGSNKSFALKKTNRNRTEYHTFWDLGQRSEKVRVETSLLPSEQWVTLGELDESISCCLFLTCDPFVTTPKMRGYLLFPSMLGSREFGKVIQRQASMEFYSHRTFLVASRKSFCLRGRKPKMEVFQDKCFICLLNIDVGNLKPCRLLPLCGKFLKQTPFSVTSKKGYPSPL